MDKAAVYRITVKGVLPESFVDRMGGLKILKRTDTLTVLEGRLPDQAAVMGALDALYGFHLPLIEVVCIENCECKTTKTNQGANVGLAHKRLHP